MINSVRVLNDRGVDQTLVFNEITNGITLGEVAGLGPVKAELITSKKANGDGINVSGRNVGSRNIVFNLGLSDIAGKTVEEVRYDIYDYFPVGEVVDLRFTVGTKVRQISGTVESVEPVIFSQEPTVQVSVICEDPYFVDYLGEDVDNEITLTTENIMYTVDYEGKSNTGVVIFIRVINPPTGLGNLLFFQDVATLTRADRGFTLADFDLSGITGAGLQTDDVIRIETTPGSKSATLVRGSTTYNIMGAMKDSGGFYLNEDQWPLLKVATSSNFKYQATVLGSADLSVEVHWDVLIEGL